jgi:tRNA (guanine37-N1)-methyltransferase
MKQSLGRTWRRRPDLLAALTLSAEQAALLEEYKLEEHKLQSKEVREPIR